METIEPHDRNEQRFAQGGRTTARSAKNAPYENTVPPHRYRKPSNRLPKNFCLFAFISPRPADRQTFKKTDLLLNHYRNQVNTIFVTFMSLRFNLSNEHGLLVGFSGDQALVCFHNGWCNHRTNRCHSQRRRPWRRLSRSPAIGKLNATESRNYIGPA